MFHFPNIADGQTVHQRCVLVQGRIQKAPAGRVKDFVRVQVSEPAGDAICPEQKWPLTEGWFKALVLLNPGENKIRFDLGADDEHATTMTLHYTPLLQTPPLHLAILVAKDSPLMIDCPPAKFGMVSSAHSSLEAAIAKFRMTAYMWQALTAEEMMTKGLQRRSFRLDEEWTTDTLFQSRLRDNVAQSTPKVHLIRTDKTVAELRDMQYAQQNSKAQKPNELHTIFTEALLKHGAPFSAELQPVVAGLILDSTYNVKDKMIVGHAALGSHDAKGLSLGVFGSHLTYSWPRCMEEITDCLLDTTAPGSLVGNDNGECASIWEACAVGQGAFLHEVGHAFSAPHTTGIMVRGYSKDWPKCFLSRTAKSIQSGAEGITPVTDNTPNDCRWDIRDLLRFTNLAHFRLPGDVARDPASPVFTIVEPEKDDTASAYIGINCESGIAYLRLNGKEVFVSTLQEMRKSHIYSMEELQAMYGSNEPFVMEVLGWNGKSASCDPVKLLSDDAIVRIPGAKFQLRKKSVTTCSPSDDLCNWTVLLKKRGRNGALVEASKVDIRVGCVLDGAIVHYKDGSKVPCGPRGPHGDDPSMGGHQARKLAIPSGQEVIKVIVNRGYGNIEGLRMALSGGRAMGALNGKADIHILQPDEGQKVVGFYGSYDRGSEMCTQFGIVTAPKEADIDSIYDMPELQNNYRKKSGRQFKKRKTNSDWESADDDEDDTSEDEDDGYDNDEDMDDI